MPPILTPRASAAKKDLTIVVTSVLTIAALVTIIFTLFYLRRRRRIRNRVIRSRTPRSHPASIPSDKPSRWQLGNTATATTTAARRLSVMTCRSPSVTIESLRRITKERVRLKARAGDVRAGNTAISAPRDARTEDGVRLSKFPYGLDAPLPLPRSAQNLGQTQQNGEAYGLCHGHQNKPRIRPGGFGGLGLPNNRHAVVGDNASDVHPLYRGSLENQKGNISSNNYDHLQLNVNNHKATPGHRSPSPAGHGYEYAYPENGDKPNTGFLHDWHPNLSPLHEDSQLPSYQPNQVHSDRITSSPSPSHSQFQPRATSPAKITEHRDLIERLHRFGIASSSSSPTPSSTSQKPMQKPLPAALDNVKLEEGPVEKRTDPETPRTVAFSLRRREAERIAQARCMRSFSPTQRSDHGGWGHSTDEGGGTRGGPETRKLRHRSSDTELTGSLYSRFSRHRQGPIQRDLGCNLRDKREWKWEWELDEDRDLDFDRDRDLEKGVVVLPQVEEDGSLSDPRPDGPFPPRRASLGFGFESIGLDGLPVPAPSSSPSPWSLRQEKEKPRKKRGKGGFENEGGAVSGIEENGLEDYLALVGKETGYEGQRMERKKNNNVNNRITPTLPHGSDMAPTSAATGPYRSTDTDITTSDADTKSLAAFTHPSIAPQPLVVRKIPSTPRIIHEQHEIEHRFPLSSPYGITQTWKGVGERRARSPEMMLNGSSTFTSDFDEGQGLGHGPDFLLDPTWGVRATVTYQADPNKDVLSESETDRQSADDLVEGLAGLGVRMERGANGLFTSRSKDEYNISPTNKYSDGSGSSSSLGLPVQSPGTSPDFDQGGVKCGYGDDGGDDYHAIMQDLHGPSAPLPSRPPKTKYGDAAPVSSPSNPPLSLARNKSYGDLDRPIMALKAGQPSRQQPHSQAQTQAQSQQQLQPQILTSSSLPLSYRIDPRTRIETEDTVGRGSMAQSTWEADLLSSYTTSASAPAAPTPAPNPTLFLHERGPIPMVCTREHTHIMPETSPGAPRRAVQTADRVVDKEEGEEAEEAEERRGKGKEEKVERQKVRLGFMTGTVEEGGRGWF